MKYMGSKRSMLKNGLGHLLDNIVPKSHRFVDLFSGSGAVATYVAQKTPIPVIAFDLQEFSVILTQAVIGRCKSLNGKKLWDQWHKRAQLIVDKVSIPFEEKFTRAYVKRCRIWSEQQFLLPITKAYGGHYFCPNQAVWIDALRSTIPQQEPNKTVALAALIQAASQCAASPGHTAQPFQPTSTAKLYLQKAWDKSIFEHTKTFLIALADLHALRVGTAKVKDANLASLQIREGDLVFIDPPYSGVHYSRFYHVLETIAKGECGRVSGVGRYPDQTFRPKSRFSVKSKSVLALSSLLQTISERNARAIVTFPDHICSNGLSGNLIRELANRFFHIKEKIVSSKFSTLGGNDRKSKTGNIRGSRQLANELILVLNPKRQN